MDRCERDRLPGGAEAITGSEHQKHPTTRRRYIERKMRSQSSPCYHK